MIEFNKHANVIYNDAGEKNVAAVVLYPGSEGGGNPAHNCLYWLKTDDWTKNRVLADELTDLAMKGLVLIEVAEGYLVPVVCIKPSTVTGEFYTSVLVSDTTYGDNGEFTSATIKYGLPGYETE